MSFVFAILQLVGLFFGQGDTFLEQNPGAIDAPTKAELLERPLVDPCAGTSCR